MNQWTPDNVAALITALTGLATAIGAAWAGYRAHKKIDSHLEDVAGKDQAHG